MGMVVLLAACLLAASATPIDNVSGDYMQDTPHTTNENANDKQHDDVSANTSHVSGEDNRDTHEERGPVLDDTLPISTDDNTDVHRHEGALPNDTLPASTDDDTDYMTEKPATSSVSTVSTPSTELEESTQATTKGSFTPPPDADPEDCRNASKPNHAFLLCTYSCQEDEMFTAPDHSVCFLDTDNGTRGNRITQEYNQTHHDASKIGVCYDGQCVSNSTYSPGATTESSPARNTSAKISGETELTTYEQVSVTTTKMSDTSVSFQQPTQLKNSSTEDVGNPENPAATVGPAEPEDVPSTAASDSVALPAALPDMTS